jgi:hypothetical protein
MSQPDTGDQVAALSALYQSDRSDLAMLSATQVAVVATATTYFGIGLATIAIAESTLLRYVSLFLPLPLWGLLLFVVFLAPITMHRADASEVTEYGLFTRSALAELRGRVGMSANRPLAQSDTRTGRFAAITLGVVYSTFVFAVVLFSVIAVARSVTAGPPAIFIVAACVLYAALLLFVAYVGWRGIRDYPTRRVRQIRVGRNASPPSNPGAPRISNP